MISSFSRHLMVAAGVFFYAGQVLAFFDAEALVGKRWYEIDNDSKSKVSAQEVDFAAHLDPIPLVPVAFGVRAAMGSLKKEDLGWSSVDEAKVIEAGLDVMAWVPLVPFVTPYARVTLPLFGEWVEKGKTTDTSGKKVDATSTAKISGVQLAAGAKLPLAPLISLLAEVGRGMETYKLDEVKVDGVKLGGLKSYKLSSNSFLIGAEVGF